MYNDKIKVGTGITVELEDGSQYSSMVQNIDDDSRIVHISPIFNAGTLVMPHRGTNVRVVANAQTCCYSFYGVINDYTKLDNLKVIEIRRTNEIEKMQRRRGFRVEKSIPLDIKIYGLFNITSVEKKVAITAADISEGGIGIYWPEPLEINRFLDCGININNYYYLVRCRVARCFKDGNQYRIGLEILGNDETFRQKMRQFVFKEQINK